LHGAGSLARPPAAWADAVRLFSATSPSREGELIHFQFGGVPELGLGVDVLSLHCQALFAGTGGGPVLSGASIELLLDGAL
jgi:hypothetical protein